MKKYLTGTLAALLGLGVAGALFYQLSPWPRVWLIRSAWDDGTSTQGQSTHLLESQIRIAFDVEYGRGADDRYDVIMPAAPGTYPAVVWMHGGGFVGGVKEGVTDFLTVLASHGYTVINVEYTKAPNAHYPTQIHQLAAATAHARAHAQEYSLDPSRIILAGDSAGAHMVAQAALAAVDGEYAAGAGIAQRLPAEAIAGLVLASGPYDPGPVLANPGAFSWFLDSVLWAYLGEREVTAMPVFAYASITDHASPGLPPVFISSGAGDPLHPQSLRLAERLQQLGVPVTTSFPEGDWGHEFEVDLAGEAAQANLAKLVDYLQTLR